MKRNDSEERLDRISTHWSQVQRAHSDGSEVQENRNTILMRYQGAVYRYLLAMVQDPALAEELCQQFAVHLLEGQFHRADPGRGRFRDYIKTSIINLVRRHHKMQGRQPQAMLDPMVIGGAIAARASDEETFDREWREELMTRTWKQLHDERPKYHDLLKLRIEFPDMTSRQLAERYEAESGQPIQPSNVRKTLARAHAKFADLLVREVASSLDAPAPQSLQDELEALDLLKYSRSALRRWAAGR